MNQKNFIVTLGLPLDADDEYEDIEEKFGGEEVHGKEQGREPPKLTEEELLVWDEEASLSKLGVTVLLKK